MVGEMVEPIDGVWKCPREARSKTWGGMAEMVLGPGAGSAVFVPFLSESRNMVVWASKAADPGCVPSPSSSSLSMISASRTGEVGDSSGGGEGTDGRPALLAEAPRWLSVMLCTPKLFSSVRKKVSPEGPAGAAPLLLLLLAVAVLVRTPGDGEREASDEGRDFGRDVAAADEDEGGEAEAAKTSSKGRMAVRCASRAARGERCAGDGDVRR
jgi:hypothetical protein